MGLLLNHVDPIHLIQINTPNTLAEKQKISRVCNKLFFKHLNQEAAKVGTDSADMVVQLATFPEQGFRKCIFSSS